MKLRQLIDEANTLADESLDDSVMTQYINQCTARINARAKALFPDMDSTKPEAILPLPDKWVRALYVPFVAARIKQQDSSQFEYNDLYAEFETALSEFITYFEIPPKYQDLSADWALEPNVVLSPEMSYDSNADGVVDSFVKVDDTNLTTTFSVDSAQKINVTASTGAGTALVGQSNIAIEPGQTYNFEVEGKVDGVTGGFIGTAYLSWYDDSNTLISSTPAVNVNSIYFDRIVILGAIAPSNAKTLKVSLGAKTTASGDKGTVYFRNCYVRKAPMYAHTSDIFTIPPFPYITRW